MTDMKTESGAKQARPKPATTGLPKAWDQLLVVGGEEAGRVEEAVPALVVRAYEVGENNPHGWAEGEYRADLVVFNAHGSAATPYVGVLVVGNESDAKSWLDDQIPSRRAPEDVGPARRAMVAFKR
jgi:hypothetical protein